MPDQTVTAEFPDARLADSAIGRLEVLGIPPRNINKTSASGSRVIVSANVEERHTNKARLILAGDGTVVR